MDNTLQIIRYLLDLNQDLVVKTALRNCHCLGLNSFVINDKPRMRLFIAEDDCELYKPFDPLNPVIPIHSHKYDDCFINIRGQLIHHFYTKASPGQGLVFNSYRHHRIGDGQTNLRNLGPANLHYDGSIADVEVLSARTLHTVSLEEPRSAWIIVETFEDPEFKQIGYHQNLVERPELYQPFKDPINYLKARF